jgi:hypothetical protein
MQVTVTYKGFKETGLELEQFVEQIKADLQTEVSTDIKQRTPKKSGRARNSWKQRTSGRDLEVRNTVDYIERLEKGYSSQARNGFTQQAITTAVTNVSNRPIKK